MTAFQWIFAPVLAAAAVATLVVAARGRISRRLGLSWTMAWTAALAAVLRPQITAKVAQLLGIGRGVDLVLYVSVIAGAFLAMAFYGRIRRIERAVTKLVRAQAIDRARMGTDSKGP